MLGFAMIGSSAAQSSPPISERRFALVIGNGAYASSPLRNPVNDARAMARALRGLGFDVIAHENIAEKDMRRAIFEFGDKLKKGGVGLFFFAGHGVQIDGRNFLIPLGAEITSERDVELEAIDIARVLARMDEAKNRLNIVILDACRDNPYGRSFRGISRGLASIDAPSGTLIAYATAPGKVARDGTGSNSLYTAALLRAIEVPGIRIEDVFKRVRKAVSEQTSGEQVPWEASSLIGDFTFALPVASTSPAAARPSATVAGAIDEMVVVPAGEFWMGSRVEEVSRLKEECRGLGETAVRCKDWYERELPRHRVRLDTFYIDRYEVANVLFERFVNARAHITTAEREGSGWSYVPRDDRWQWLAIPGASWRTPNGPGSEAPAHHPVVQVSWRDAEAY